MHHLKHLLEVEIKRKYARFEVFRAVKIQDEVLCVVTPCSDVEDLRNVGILPQHYTASQPRSESLDECDVSEVTPCQLHLKQYQHDGLKKE
jgi:hypothetical protein